MSRPRVRQAGDASATGHVGVPPRNFGPGSLLRRHPQRERAEAARVALHPSDDLAAFPQRGRNVLWAERRLGGGVCVHTDGGPDVLGRSFGHMDSETVRRPQVTVEARLLRAGHPEPVGDQLELGRCGAARRTEPDPCLWRQFTALADEDALVPPEGGLQGHLDQLSDLDRFISFGWLLSAAVVAAWDHSGDVTPGGGGVALELTVS